VSAHERGRADAPVCAEQPSNGGIIWRIAAIGSSRAHCAAASRIASPPDNPIARFIVGFVARLSAIFATLERLARWAKVNDPSAIREQQCRQTNGCDVDG
jgi:hypothetical protein